MSAITGVRHPYWSEKSLQWDKWRACYDGGPNYVSRYLEKFSDREEKSDFDRRQRITPTPNFAKAAVNDIRNAIFQRLVEVARRDGSKSYQDAMEGLGFGVDLQGSSMNAFIGRQLLAELLVMSRVGVFVDMPQIKGKTLKDMVGVRPYLYRYRAEDILSWTEKPGSPDEITEILLLDHVEVFYTDTTLPCGIEERYRHMWIDEFDGKCHCRFYKQGKAEWSEKEQKEVRKDIQVDINGNPTVEDMILEINFIPFVMLDLSDSLFSDVANHQIALLNLESSDITYSLKSNFPFYVEQDDGRIKSSHLLHQGVASADGTAAQAGKANDDDIRVGAMNGRRYSKDMNEPSFIHPSSEPLKASMAKQEQLKNDIRTLVNLNLSNVKAAGASAESKQMDERGLESGLSSIGLVLQHCERRIEFYWRQWEGSKKIASIKYPEKWSLKTDADKREDAKSLREIRDTIPSKTFQKSVSKEIARLVLGGTISYADLNKIMGEIDSAKTHTADPETIFKAIDRGALDLELAAEILGWPIETVEKAAEQHADRASRIAEAQAKVKMAAMEDAGARGIPDMDSSPGQSGKDEKATAKEKSQDAAPTDKERGKEQKEAKL